MSLNGDDIALAIMCVIFLTRQFESRSDRSGNLGITFRNRLRLIILATYPTAAEIPDEAVCKIQQYKSREHHSDSDDADCESVRINGSKIAGLI